ncbi:hypothetical protein C5O80_24975 [Burkholderia sp. SRS-46]|nr:hypothetical protein C5O80_24975 [Burkholderia sp. SRS-46]
MPRSPAGRWRTRCDDTRGPVRRRFTGRTVRADRCRYVTAYCATHDAAASRFTMKNALRRGPMPAPQGAVRKTA